LGLEMAVGFDAAEAPLRVDEVHQVSPGTAARVEPRAVLPSTWHELLRG
jgi:hypothetical protein